MNVFFRGTDARLDINVVTHVDDGMDTNEHEGIEQVEEACKNPTCQES